MQKGNLVCLGDIKTTKLTVENERNMNAVLITTNEVLNNNLQANNIISKLSSIENIKSSSGNNIIKVLNIIIIKKNKN
jgi:hypothetical protein